MAIQSVIILGTGGNSIDILDTMDAVNRAGTAPKYQCRGFLDDRETSWGRDLCGIKVLGPLEAASDWGADSLFVNGIGTSTNFWNKEAIIGRTRLPPDRFLTLVHPTASVSRMSTLGRGTVIFQNATITSNVTVGSHVVVLPNSILSHDSSVGDYTCIAGGVCISGEVNVGQACYLGTNCAIKERVRIGDGSLIGMGSVVLKDVPENSVVAGNPARFLRVVRPIG